MTSCLFSICKVQLVMQRLPSSLFRIFIDSIYYTCSCVQSKWVFLVVRTVSQREFEYSLVSDAISPRSLVTKNEVLIHVNYSKSYENKQQLEIQSAFCGHTRFSIFTACCYLRDAENKMICESVTNSSELSDHSRAANSIISPRD